MGKFNVNSASFLQSKPILGGTAPLQLASSEVMDTVSLRLFDNRTTVFSVVDSKGLVVRPMHNWLSHLRRQVGLGVGVGTVVAYGRILSYLCRWIERTEPHKGLDIANTLKVLDRSEVNSWLNYMKQYGENCNSTLHTREACIKKFLTWLTTHEGGRIRDADDSPWGREDVLNFITSPGNSRSPKFITTEAIITLLSGFYNECERCMFHTQYDTGLRIEEIVNLRLEELPNPEHYPAASEFIPFHIAGVKGRADNVKHRITLISRAVLNRIRRYNSSLEYRLAEGWGMHDKKKPVFLTCNGLQWSPRNASKQFKSAVRRQGLQEDFCTHWMRHGTAFSVLRSDMAKNVLERLVLLQTLLGHEDLKTVKIYTQIPPDMLLQLNDAGREIDRLVEAEEIRTNTFLPPNLHKENRGRRDK